jgi:hypothetical protein
MVQVHFFREHIHVTCKKREIESCAEKWHQKMITIVGSARSQVSEKEIQIEASPSKMSGWYVIVCLFQ